MRYLPLKPNDRLIVAADYSGSPYDIEKKVLELAQNLEGLEVYVKLNSAARGRYSLIKNLHDLGLRVFIDLKLIDIPNTMATDAETLLEYKPEILTVMACAGIDGMRAVQTIIGHTTEVLGVTILTSLNEEECQGIFNCSTKAGVLRFARMTQLAGLGGLILSPKELEIVRGRPELTLSLNTPGVRPLWSIIEEDDQKRVLTPKQSIQNGATRIVIGRPITQAAPNSKGLPKNPREAVIRTIEEIESAA